VVEEKIDYIIQRLLSIESRLHDICCVVGLPDEQIMASYDDLVNQFGKTMLLTGQVTPENEAALVKMDALRDDLRRTLRAKKMVNGDLEPPTDQES
jgi:hypothetical protein